MDKVAGLVFIPPPERFGFHAEVVERSEGALNLNGLPAMREHEREAAIDQDFHAGNVP
jgi:hypothetical protein